MPISEVGLLVLTAPLAQTVSCFKALLPTVAKQVNRLLYVQIFPGASRWPPPPDGLLTVSTRKAGIAPPPDAAITRCSRVLTAIYGHSATVPRLDVRVLMTGLKAQVPLVAVSTKHKVEVVYFDPEASDDFVSSYSERCFADVGPRFKKLDLDDGPALAEDPDLLSAKAGPTDKLYGNVVLGGTFDRLHCGHKILLSEAVVRCRSSLTVGVADGDPLLRGKVLRELILPCAARIRDVKEFLKDVDPSLEEHNVVSILDPYGPSVVDSTLELIVGSAETAKGCAKVNDVRRAASMSLLDVHLIPMAVVDDESDVISSTSRRMRLLGEELAAPSNAWDRNLGPYVVGLTGGSASGKTSIAGRLGELGAGVVDCDRLAHRVYAKGSRCHDEVVDAFGSRIVGSDGEIDRGRLGRLVFGAENVAELRRLESIVWPEIWKMASDRLLELWREEGRQVVVLDAAVMLAAGWEGLVHQVWVCVVDREEAVARIVERDGKSVEDANKRLDSQYSNEEFVSKANVVFCSKWEPAFTGEQVERAWRRLQAEHVSPSS